MGEGERVDGWNSFPLWLSGEHVSPRKGLATVAGAWWSGGEKASRVRAWFEGGGEDEGGRENK